MCHEKPMLQLSLFVQNLYILKILKSNILFCFLIRWVMKKIYKLPTCFKGHIRGSVASIATSNCPVGNLNPGPHFAMHWAAGGAAGTAEYSWAHSATTAGQNLKKKFQIFIIFYKKKNMSKDRDIYVSNNLGNFTALILFLYSTIWFNQE